MADKYQDKYNSNIKSINLKNAAIKFITSNASKMIITKSWNDLCERRHDLLLQLYKDLILSTSRFYVSDGNDEISKIDIKSSNSF